MIPPPSHYQSGSCPKTRQQSGGIVTRKWWQICAAVWFGVFAVLVLTDIRFKAQDVIQGLLAAAVCVLALLDK